MRSVTFGANVILILTCFLIEVKKSNYKHNKHYILFLLYFTLSNNPFSFSLKKSFTVLSVLSDFNKRFFNWLSSYNISFSKASWAFELSALGRACFLLSISKMNAIRYYSLFLKKESSAYNVISKKKIISLPLRSVWRCFSYITISMFLDWCDCRLLSLN